MLNAYFDDSGTHDQSEIVIVAGVCGTEWQVRSLERGWASVLERPLDGAKPPLSRFHMAQCQISDGEFLRWSRTETDYLVHLLQNAIASSHVAIYGIACARKDWDELIVGDLRSVLGNAEGHCIRNCFVKARQWAINCTFDPHMAFTFDDRPSPIRRDAYAVYDAFRKESESPKIHVCTFGSSKYIIPLQAADMVAWELYHHAQHLLNSGFEVAPERMQLRRLCRSNVNQFQIATRSAMERMVSFWSERVDAGHLRQLADHFDNFDPSLNSCKP